MESVSNSMKSLRLLFGVNYFKWLLLGKLHLAGNPQTTSVFNKLSEFKQHSELFSERVWHNWFHKKSSTMHPDNAGLLDEIAAKKFDISLNENGETSNKPLPFFSELIRGGLVKQLLSSKKTVHIRNTLKARAEEYFPITLLHLHLDAVEVNTITDSFYDVSWGEVTEIAASRILDLLSLFWGPRYGKFYASFSSPLKLRWGAADDDERLRIRESYARLKPDLFEEKLQPGAWPNWRKIGVNSDAPPQHIYKTLFAMAADPDFLVGDRFEAWVLSLSTAALAMRALAWTDRYKTFGVEITDEMLFWSAFHHILFDSEVKEIDEWNLRSAMNRCNAEWGERSLSVFANLHRGYSAELSKYGISAQHIYEVVKNTEQNYPLVYQG